MSFNAWDRYNVDEITELEGLNQPTANFFIELATREFVQREVIILTDNQLVSSIDCATSKRTVSRWLTALYDAGLLGSEKYMVGQDRWRRRLFLLDKGIEAQAKLKGQTN